MKKYFYSVFAAATLLLAASCSQDEDFVQPSGEMTTFSVSLENAATTRAAGDGQTVDKLYYEVYQGQKKVLDNENELATIDKGSATVVMPLLKGEKYDIIFWAQSSKSTIYDASDLKNIKVEYENVTANNEANDAFFNALVDFKAGGNVTTVELRRPFAQLNIGTTTDDWAEAKEMVDGDIAPVTKSEVTVNGLANAFNALTGEATGDENVTFKAADLIGKTFTANEKTYQSLSMNYLLVPGEKAPQGLNNHKAATENEVKITTDITATFWRSTTELFTLEVPNVPVQRNYRTNIIGDLLAGNKTFEIVVKEDFDNDHNIEKAYVATTAEFKEIIDALNAEGYNGPKNVVITLDGDIEWTTGAGHGTTPFLTENSIVDTLTIMGQNKTITAIGQGIGAIRAANGGKLIFNDVVVADESESYAEGSWEMGYLEFAGKLEFNNSTFVNAIMVCGATANNSTGGDATFTNCTFNSNKESEYDVWVSGNNATFTECTFQGYRGLKMHEAYGSEITSVTVDACTFDNLSKKPGVAIGTVNAETAVTIKNSLFHNCQAGDQGLYIYESDTDVTTFNFSADENNTVINDGEASDLTITSVAAFKAFAAAVNNGTSYAGKTVTLAADLDLNNEPWTPIGNCTSGNYFQGTFDGNSKTISNLYVDDSANASEYASAGLFGWVDAAGATIKNVKVDGATVKGSHWTGVIAGYFTGRIENCTVTNATVEGFNVNDEANGDKVGGIVGYLNEHSELNNNTVSNSTIKGNRDIGGIAGSVAKSTDEMQNNKVKNVTITYETAKSYASAGAIVSGRTGYVADGTNVATNVTIILNATSAESLAQVLTANDKNIEVVLQQKIDLPISSLGSQTAGSGEYKLGGEITESITIDLNNHTLNLTTNYWSSIGCKNTDATITIKNGTMTSSQTTGTWNSYDVTFANCNYDIKDVTFSKAIAFTNGEKNITLTNVAINETHDYYAMWISAKGQTITIDGLTVDSDGRGIKIDEEYVSSPAKVTLNIKNSTFETAKKAAIMVKSSAGATIDWLTGNNISAVAADKVNAVWVDEASADYANLVTVTGGTVIVEPTATVANLENLADESTKEGGYVLLSEDVTGSAASSSGYGAAGLVVDNGATIDGNGNTLTVNNANGTWDCAVNAKNGTIKNLTINGAFRGIFMGSATGDVVIDNVVLDKVCYTFNSDGGNKEYSVTIKNSTLNGWTSYSDVHKHVTFTSCKFGKGTGGYQYAFCRPYNASTFENCEFAEGFEFDTTQQSNIVFKNCTYNGLKITAENAATLTTFFYNGVGSVTFE